MKISFFKLSNVPILISAIIQIALMTFIVQFFGILPTQSFIISTLVYGITVLIMISPIGEAIVRLFCGAKTIERRDWQNKLNIVMQSIKTSAETRNISIPEEIKIFYISSPIPNCFSIGKSICLSSALLDSDISVIKGCVAHETAHLVSYDSVATLLVNIGNLPMMAIFALLQGLSSINRFTSMFNRSIIIGLIHFFVAAMLFVPRIILRVFLGITRLIMSVGSRKKEFEADRFAVEMGFGRELRHALLQTDFESQTETRGLWQNLISAHPSVHERVGKIDRIIGNSSSQYCSDLYDAIR